MLAEDDVNLGTFTFNGDIVRPRGEPAVQIDSNMTTFSVRNLLNSDTTSVIGGDVTNLTIGEMGDGTLTVTGAVKSLKVTTNTAGGNFVANSFGTITLGLTASTSDYGDLHGAAWRYGQQHRLDGRINGTVMPVPSLPPAPSVRSPRPKASLEDISAEGDVKASR